MIKTSKENREIVARLSRKLGLGSENHISRIAFSYSINSDKKLMFLKSKIPLEKYILNLYFSETTLTFTLEWFV